MIQFNMIRYIMIQHDWKNSSQTYLKIKAVMVKFWFGYIGNM
jgi:hypothetical protein